MFHFIYYAAWPGYQSKNNEWMWWQFYWEDCHLHQPSHGHSYHFYGNNVRIFIVTIFWSAYPKIRLPLKLWKRMIRLIRLNHPKNYDFETFFSLSQFVEMGKKFTYIFLIYKGKKLEETSSTKKFTPKCFFYQNDFLSQIY